MKKNMLMAAMVFVAHVSFALEMVKIPETGFEMSKTEITQETYTEVMGENPSNNVGNNLPVEYVSWYDAIVFCNRLSMMHGLTPVYSVNGITDPEKWGYTPHKRKIIDVKVKQRLSATGYRLPTVDEWIHAAKGGQEYRYAGSNSGDEAGWYGDNSCDSTHPVGEKKPNGYGLYDMSGNVKEWCWDTFGESFDIFREYKYALGGCYYSSDYDCSLPSYDCEKSCNLDIGLGFRVVRLLSRDELNSGMMSNGSVIRGYILNMMFGSLGTHF